MAVGEGDICGGLMKMHGCGENHLEIANNSLNQTLEALLLINQAINSLTK